MKRITMWAAAFLFAGGMAITAQNQGQAGPRFVDADKDGKCDVCGRTPGQGQGQGMRQGRGPGAGAGRGMMRGRMAGRRGQCPYWQQQNQQQTGQQGTAEQPKK